MNAARPPGEGTRSHTPQRSHILGSRVTVSPFAMCSAAWASWSVQDSETHSPQIRQNAFSAPCDVCSHKRHVPSGFFAPQQVVQNDAVPAASREGGECVILQKQ